MSTALGYNSIEIYNLHITEIGYGSQNDIKDHLVYSFIHHYEYIIYVTIYNVNVKIKHA